MRNEWLAAALRLLRRYGVSWLAGLLIALMLLLGVWGYRFLAQAELSTARRNWAALQAQETVLRSQLQQLASAGPAFRVARAHGWSDAAPAEAWRHKLASLQRQYPAAGLQIEILPPAALPGFAGVQSLRIETAWQARDEDDFSLLYRQIHALPGTIRPLECVLEREAGSLAVRCIFQAFHGVAPTERGAT